MAGFYCLDTCLAHGHSFPAWHHSATVWNPRGYPTPKALITLMGCDPGNAGTGQRVSIVDCGPPHCQSCVLCLDRMLHWRCVAKPGRECTRHIDHGVHGRHSPDLPVRLSHAACRPRIVCAAFPPASWPGSGDDWAGELSCDHWDGVCAWGSLFGRAQRHVPAPHRRVLLRGLCLAHGTLIPG